MRKHFLIPFLALIVINTIHSQTRGTKVGYIDMEYICRMFLIMLKQQLRAKAQNGNKKLRPKNWDQ
jgi:hypothetical protein